MNHSHLIGTRKHLVSQLAFFDEHHQIFLDTYFQQYNRERTETDKLLRTYIEQLESILRNDDELLLEALNRIALLGSSVDVHFLDDAVQEEYTVVYPTEADPDYNRISFLSPMGRQLLLAKIGEERLMSSPSSQFRVRIDHVKYSYLGGFTEV